ncbi:hypothetical protein EPI10_033161 [Gossypium australe]|uniref:Uncharacterized protein n=1 Tax=Gossypium australe TaxID=47621 RepID=A0A5B6X616_9ROSI|nr:hypothetical protein EPI10_033161 [Gossypium australe]
MLRKCDPHLFESRTKRESETGVLAFSHGFHLCISLKHIMPNLELSETLASFDLYNLLQVLTKEHRWLSMSNHLAPVHVFDTTAKTKNPTGGWSCGFNAAPITVSCYYRTLTSKLSCLGSNECMSRDKIQYVSKYDLDTVAF